MIVYEYVSFLLMIELERFSICEERNIFGDVDGMFFNLGFFDFVRNQYGECFCWILVIDWGVVRLSVIIINFIYFYIGIGRWSLNVKFNNGIMFI